MFLALNNDDNAVTIAAAGAIPLLMQLLGPGSEAAVQDIAREALKALAHSNEDHRDAIDAAISCASVLQGSLRTLEIAISMVAMRLGN